MDSGGLKCSFDATLHSREPRAPTQIGDQGPAREIVLQNGAEILRELMDRAWQLSEIPAVNAAERMIGEQPPGLPPAHVMDDGRSRERLGKLGGIERLLR